MRAIAYAIEGSMRIWPSQSTVMKRKVGSMVVVHDLQIESVAVANGIPVSHAGAAEADPHRC